jgi:hypothetical protein
MESLERRSPGAVSRLFATHPPDAERIRRTQEEIERILPARPEYVVNTSEYSAMRQRLIDLDSNRRQDSPERSPRLRTAPGAVPGQPNDAGDRPSLGKRKPGK